MFIRHHEAPWPQLVWAVVRGLVGLHYSVPRDLPFGPGPVLPHGGIKRQVGALQEGDWAAGRGGDIYLQTPFRVKILSRKIIIFGV